MTGPIAFRGEAVAYQSSPEVCMQHLGEAFSGDVAEVQEWAHSRALDIASALEGEEPEMAAQFRAWGLAAKARDTAHRMRQGEAVIFSHATLACTWELSLRPVPVGVIPPLLEAQHG